MSWTIDPPKDDRERQDLENAVIEAAKANILMFCSASDKGAHDIPTYPSKAATGKIARVAKTEKRIVVTRIQSRVVGRS